jgi:hypothetical protein
MELKKNPIALLTIYNLSLCAIARNRNRNNPIQIMRTIDSGGKFSEYPRMTSRVIGRVAPWISIIPIHPENIDIVLNLFIIW